MRIEYKIEEIIKEINNVIIILKGFDTSQMPYENKYFSFEIIDLDRIDLKEIAKKAVDEIIEIREFEDSYKWMTMEEYQIFKENAIINKRPIVILENNLYDRQFPYRKTLSNVEDIYHNLYYEEDTELEIDQKRTLENVSYFYGQIDYSKYSGNYYVTYPEVEENLQVFKLYDENPVDVIITEDYPQTDLQQIELSDNEMPFLDLINDILNEKNKKNILLILSRNEKNLPNRYLERLNIIRQQVNTEMFFTTLSIGRKVIENEQKYLEILREIYGYSTFKKIPFYKSIESHSKETIDISQAQIIDDIVMQIEKAIQGEAFRDIYITAATGTGKSVMFQIPELYLVNKYKDYKPLTLVISPLIGLMNDQVENMKGKGVTTSATINGNTPPYERENIIVKVQNQEVDFLYLSPETLQARSDIKMLIGDRNIGVVIIDEAHIVTTWGKSFRADYWYLGIYLAKLRKKYKFPIVTFTATAIYGGREDMYLDTRNSLNMISPISYFGEVRRDNILMSVRSSEKKLEDEGRDYRKTKNALALKHLKLAMKKKEKSLVYFPTVKLLMDFYSFVNQNDSELAKKTGKYYGTLSKEERDEVLTEFKSGELQFVLATKAFGMGIDIPDITNVYHYAPTGNVVDYIQEIGRAARDKDKVAYGFGIIDFLNRDMNEIKQLHGMSAIKKTQILEVMSKVLAVYKEKGNNRNLIISPEDFKYIFVQGNRDEDSLANKVKTVLLMIEKDFSSPNKLGYSPFVARPRSLFANDLVLVNAKMETMFTKSRLSMYISKLLDIEGKTYSAVYQVNLGGIWEKYYKRMSYPSFKYALFSQAEREKLQHKNLFEKFIYTSGVEITINKEFTKENIIAQYRVILDVFEKFVNSQRISRNQFTVVDLGNYIMQELKIGDKFEARAFAQTIINSAFEFNKIHGMPFISERKNSKVESPRYIVNQDGDVFSRFVMSAIVSALNPKENYCFKDAYKIISFHHRSHSQEIDAKIAALGIGEARKILSYQVLGGNDPQIYLRMNSIYPLEKAIKQGNFYQNSILKDIQGKYYTSVEMLKFLFMKEQVKGTAKEKILAYTEWFWDKIEDYFMGILPNEVEEAISKNIKQ